MCGRPATRGVSPASVKVKRNGGETEMRKKAIWAAGFLGLLLILSTHAAMAQVGQMRGTIKDEEGQLYINKPVYIDREDIGGHYETKTDKNGRFTYNLPVGRFTVSILMKDGNKYSVNRVP